MYNSNYLLNNIKHIERRNICRTLNLNFVHRYWLMMMSLLEFYLQLWIKKEASERTKDMKEVSDQEEQRLENLDNPHAVV